MRARLLAPLVAAVLGIAGGVTTALVTHSDPVPVASDPLGLGIPLVNQGCSLKAITVLGYGANSAALSPAQANATGKIAYLRSADSCDTVYGPVSDPHPAYVVYSGPYDSKADPCATRMDGDANRGSVTVLRAGNQDFVKCACVLKSTAGPRLEVGMDADARDVAWIRLLQIMLRDDDRTAFPPSAVTGEYDKATAARVEHFQAGSPGKRTVPGVVDATTWKILTDQLCKNYSW